IGGLDIYLSEKDASGDWGPAVNLGTEINTPFNEDNPFITKNDSLLFFSSEGHSTMGGYDIFRSRLSGGNFKSPENIGYPLNTTDDDKFFQPFNNEANGFYSMTAGYKRKDIFYITLSGKDNQLFAISGKYGLEDTIAKFNEDNTIFIIDRNSGDTLDIQHPEKESGLYNFYVTPGNFRLAYTAPGYLTEHIDTSAVSGDTARIIKMRDVMLSKANAPKYAKLDLSNIPEVTSIDSSILIRNLRVYDVTDNDVKDTSILYYTVQVMALYNPVDISYFKYVSDIKVFYNDNDRFYRYTTGVYKVKNDAYGHKAELINKGYPDDLFIKKVMKISGEEPVKTLTYFAIQLKASRAQVDIGSTFPGLKGVRETREVDNMYHYLYGRYTTYEEAKQAIALPQFRDFGDAFIREIGSLIKNK
ncbi:MAG: hypothetical protein Q8868_15315, partial [Bacteroidota bacterium]|nr:hypothetical protein [Bacteroidota bacterium]